MLLALLYDQADCIRGAALACEQQPYGDRFWNECYANAMAVGRDGETAYVNVSDPELADQLLAMQYGDGFPDGQVAAAAVEQHLAIDPPRVAARSPRAA